VRALADTNREVELATTADDVRGAAARGHIAALMGVEGGHAIENSLEKLDSLYRLGVRYMTLTWNNGNDWAGSSTDPKRHGGLTSFGRQVVGRMTSWACWWTCHTCPTRHSGTSWPPARDR